MRRMRPKRPKCRRSCETGNVVSASLGGIKYSRRSCAPVQPPSQGASHVVHMWPAQPPDVSYADSAGGGSSPRNGGQGSSGLRGLIVNELARSARQSAASQLATELASQLATEGFAGWSRMIATDRGSKDLITAKGMHITSWKCIAPKQIILPFRGFRPCKHLLRVPPNDAQSQKKNHHRRVTIGESQ